MPSGTCEGSYMSTCLAHGFIAKDESNRSYKCQSLCIPLGALCSRQILQDLVSDHMHFPMRFLFITTYHRSRPH